MMSFSFIFTQHTRNFLITFFLRFLSRNRRQPSFLYQFFFHLFKIILPHTLSHWPCHPIQLMFFIRQQPTHGIRTKELRPIGIETQIIRTSDTFGLGDAFVILTRRLDLNAQNRIAVPTSINHSSKSVVFLFTDFVNSYANQPVPNVVKREKMRAL
jgi:hypothetical protein